MLTPPRKACLGCIESHTIRVIRQAQLLETHHSYNVQIDPERGGLREVCAGFTLTEDKRFTGNLTPAHLGSTLSPSSLRGQHLFGHEDPAATRGPWGLCEV